MQKTGEFTPKSAEWAKLNKPKTCKCKGLDKKADSSKQLPDTAPFIDKVIDTVEG